MNHLTKTTQYKNTNEFKEVYYFFICCLSQLLEYELIGDLRLWHHIVELVLKTVNGCLISFYILLSESIIH